MMVFIPALGTYYFYPGELLPENCEIDRLVVMKRKGVMFAYSNGSVVKVYHIAIVRNPKGDKMFEGDGRTPEGVYFINDKNPGSGYHKNLGISYPTKQMLPKLEEEISSPEISKFMV